MPMLKTILIVDFERTSIQELRDNLLSEDFRLMTANDGEEAVKLFTSSPPDLVLTAALLPKLNGFELCKRITSGELGETRPVIMYSAIYKAEKYRKEALAACGALEFLEKPIPKWQLLKAVRSAFSVIPVNGSKDPARAPLRDQTVKSSPTPDPRLQIQSSGDDLLDVDQLLEVQSVDPPNRGHIQTESILSELPLAPIAVESIDTSEIDAAVDAFRIDLDDEVRARDARWADESRAQASTIEGQNVLEFEAIQSDASALGQSNSGDFELDGIELGAAPGEGSACLSPGNETSDSTFTPSFSVKSTESRTWLPLAVLAVLLILAVACLYWFKMI